MLIGETFNVAFRSIRANKLRALLTMLGVIIGVGAVITVVAMGTGAQRNVENQINALGANLITIEPSRSRFGGVESSSTVPMTIDDAVALRRDAAEYIDAMAPEMERRQQVEYGNQNINANVKGTTPEYPEARNTRVEYGRMFTTGDDDSRQRYAVLGANVPDNLGQNPAAMIGQTVTIRQIPFEVIGVMASRGSIGWSNPDDEIYIPLTTARFRVMGNDRLGQISLTLPEGVNRNTALIQFERIMRREHRIRPGEGNNFNLRSPTDYLATAEETSKTFSALLLSIAAVSLVVGGIGIMNIMLVSVTERTKEIGIRKALGATRIVIMSQFLIEALMLCLVGGVIGIGFGVVASNLVSKNLGWSTEISPTAVAVAFGFSALVGLFFGLWPARRAASLDPIQSLRYE
ncbi:MAG TPA: ABC transporter permease [Gemmatimonadales bacterium]|nr:ABC transporter permease [Gemmatimonadales bacterium]HRX17624.1 ABC transporter permease [Gemmatimonadales bacterium]